MPFPTVDNDMLNIGVSNGQIPVIGAGNKLPDSIINGGVGANQFIKLDGSARLPAVDASLLTNLPAPSGGVGAWNLLDTQIAAGSAQVDFTTGIDGTYKNYAVVITRAEQLANGSNINAKVRIGGSFRGDTGYTRAHAEFSRGSGSWNDGPSSSGDGEFILISSGIGHPKLTNGTFFLYDPADVSNLTAVDWRLSEMSTTPGTAVHMSFGAGVYTTDTGAIDGVRFYPSSGVFSSGTFKLYGIN